MNLVIVDYGIGNLRSLINAFEYIGIEDISISSDLNVLDAASKIILPGVGAFGDSIKKIDALGLRDILIHHSLVKKKPILGVCLGMQLMANRSEESKGSEGLGLIDADIVKLSASDKVPHVGFNQISPNKNNSIYSSFESQPYDFYFTHSYGMQCEDQIGQSYCDYAGGFIASFQVNNIAGVQFHPELSQKNGLNLLRNFLENR